MRKKFELPKGYEPAQFEQQISQLWEEEGCLKASSSRDPNQKTFCMVLPPPNVTGVLHMGHALTGTLEDMLARYHRMKGEEVLWIPGTDHAGIATQMVVERWLGESQKNASGKPLSRHDLGKEAFVQKIWEWKQKHGDQICYQLKQLGCSLDWSHQKFTLDPEISKAVREVFVRLYENNLIYRGNRLSQWCFRCQTVLSDLEVDETPQKGFIWKIAYPIQGGGEIIVATTRPETLFGDVAVAVHPDDPRFTAYHGKSVQIPLVQRSVPIVLDTFVDQAFGTGAVKITPAHDSNDFAVGLRHQLKPMVIFDLHGKLNEHTGSFQGMKILEARSAVVQALQEQGFLRGQDEHTGMSAHCGRCRARTELRLSAQWFVSTKPLAEPAIAAVKEGAIQFFPKQWEKTYFDWMENIQDWCISRQLWWGHAIPAWHCQACGEIQVSRDEKAWDKTPCPKCNQRIMSPDPDVLDTWFSSGLWPFSTLGWPEKLEDRFYPNSILETGFDILFFWVARMIMLGIFSTGKIPFKQVLFHAMVRDEHGEKMSKTKGNVIDPLEVTQVYGTDPLRFTLILLSGQVRDLKLSLSRVEGYRNFCNKIWNAVRFFEFQKEALALDPLDQHPNLDSWISEHASKLHVHHQALLMQLDAVIQEIHGFFEQLELHRIAERLYEFVWHEFCDHYLEISKVFFKGEFEKHRHGQEYSKAQKARLDAFYMLSYVLQKILALLHPITPFLTEALWMKLMEFSSHKMLAIAPYPKPMGFQFEKAVEKTQFLKQVLAKIRNFRGEHQIPIKITLGIQCIFSPAGFRYKPWLEDFLAELALVGGVRMSLKEDAQTISTKMVLENFGLELGVDLKNQSFFNAEEEKKRILKELKKVFSDEEHLKRKLSNASFIEKAPASLVVLEKQKLEEVLRQKAKLEALLQNK